MAAAQDIIMADTGLSNPDATTPTSKTSKSAQLSPPVTTITISELAHSGSESPESSHSDGQRRSDVSMPTSPFHSTSNTDKQCPHLLLNTSTKPQDSSTTEDSTSLVVQMAVDELRAMGETLRRANQQQRRMIEETMSQWRQEQQSQQQERHHYQYQQNYQYRQPSPQYYGSGDVDSPPAMSAGSAAAIGSSQ